MRFSTLLIAGLAAVATALPQRPGNGQSNGVAKTQGFRNGRGRGRPNGQTPGAPNNQPPAVVGAQPPAPDVANPQPTVAPGNNANIGNDNNNANQNQNQNQNGNANGAFDPALVPEFGIQAGQQPDGTGNCVGNAGKLIPCSCPPDRQAFIQMVQQAAAAGNSAGVPISFPTGNSAADQRARIGASIIVLQNLNGRGVGCPAAATTFLEQQAALAGR